MDTHSLDKSENKKALKSFSFFTENAIQDII